MIMKNVRKFWLCSHCGNIISYLKDVGVGVSCCGETMQEIIPNTTDAATEKHIPAVVREGNLLKVTVGSIPHPMTPEHYIAWIVVADGDRTYRVALAKTDTPSTEFAIAGPEVTVYAYCNLHGLWAAEF